MKKIFGIVLLFSLVLFLAASLCAEEDLEQMDDVAITEDTGEGVVTGTVVGLSATAGTISIKTADGMEKTFSVVEDETILWKGIEDIMLSDIAKGEEAEVGYYTDESGKMIASWVDVLVEETMVPAMPGAKTE